MSFYPVAQLSNVVRAVLSFVKSHYIYIYISFSKVEEKQPMKLGTPFSPLVVVNDSVGHILLIFFLSFFILIRLQARRSCTCR